MTKPRPAALRAEAFYTNGRDGLRQVLAAGAGGRVVYRNLVAGPRRASRQDATTHEATPAQMRDWGASEVDFQTAAVIQARLEAAQARITTRQRDWLLVAFPLASQPLHAPMPVARVEAAHRSLVHRLVERCIVSVVATASKHDFSVRLREETGLPLLRVLHGHPPLIDLIASARVRRIPPGS